MRSGEGRQRYTCESVAKTKPNESCESFHLRAGDQVRVPPDPVCWLRSSSPRLEHKTQRKRWGAGREGKILNTSRRGGGRRASKTKAKGKKVQKYLERRYIDLPFGTTVLPRAVLCHPSARQCRRRMLIRTKQAGNTFKILMVVFTFFFGIHHHGVTEKTVLKFSPPAPLSILETCYKRPPPRASLTNTGDLDDMKKISSFI